MTLKREFINGLIIFLAISGYFLLMEVLGLSDVFYLRVLNLFIVLYGINRTITANIASKLQGYLPHLKSAFITGMIGAVLGIIGLLIYIPYKGGEAYIQKLSQGFLFGGGTIAVPQYCIGLLFESSAATLVISFCMMQYYKSKIDQLKN
jgi:hypothetical protein